MSVGVSIGTATFSVDGSHPEELMRSADAALYRAKRAGRDRAAPEPAGLGELEETH